MRHAKQARHLVVLVLSVAVVLLLLSACGVVDYTDPVPTPPGPAQVTSTLPTSQPGVVGETYEFTFIYDTTDLENYLSPLQDSPDTVVFTWAWGDGTEGGTATVSVGADGTFNHSESHSYADDGRYGIVLSVEDPLGDPQDDSLGVKNFVVEIGEVVEEGRHSFASCDGTWHDGAAGSYAVTVHRWDITGITSSVFDFEFDARTVPDKFIVEYPASTVYLDSGWRGGADYDGQSLYPGGVTSPGDFERTRLLSTLRHRHEFVVTVISSEAGGVWDYRVRCRVY